MTAELFLHPQADEVHLAVLNRRQVARWLGERPVSPDVWVCAGLVAACVVVSRLLGRRA